ncbi:hypothetical protein DL93DRAFT_2227317 [Clavulina sp. PMI_390]|nr:hypothetical protein DL93DRAFT_2227317 [Clavulina sp. PMI_390]
MTSQITYTFSSNDYHDTAIIGPDGAAYYFTETEHGLFKKPKTTHVYRPSSTIVGQKDLVASINHRRLGDPGSIIYGGQSLTIDGWFPKQSRLSRQRSMRGPSGMYYWNRDRSEITLSDSFRNTLLNYSFSRRRSGPPPTLAVNSSVFSLDMDIVIIGWIVMCRDVELAQAAADAATGA